MPLVQPFRALRYDPSAVGGDLSAVLAPPYDVIPPEEQEQLYLASPHNVVRLILGKQLASDTDADNRYTRARRDYDAWRRDRILVQDREPAFYGVEHTFQSEEQPRTRLGFVAMLQFEEPVERVVYRHEATLAGPKADRTKLLEAVPANLESIFCIHPDARGRVQARLQTLTRTRPLTEGVLHGERIRLWAVTDPEEQGIIRAELSAAPALIADGHHRFEVAYANRARYGGVMAYFASMQDPGVVMRAIHRVVTAERLPGLRELAASCDVTPVADPMSLAAWLPQAAGTGRFGLLLDGRGFQVVLRRDVLERWQRLTALPPALTELDVSMLHGCLLPSLGLDGMTIEYAADPARALDQARRRPGMAWLLRPIPLQQVYSIASQGNVLAPKSTYFYPKVCSGLTMNPLD